MFARHIHQAPPGHRLALSVPIAGSRKLVLDLLWLPYYHLLSTLPRLIADMPTTKGPDVRHPVQDCAGALITIAYGGDYVLRGARLLTMWRGRRTLFPEMNPAIGDQHLAYPFDPRIFS
jgi:hypothetical protein